MKPRPHTTPVILAFATLLLAAAAAAQHPAGAEPRPAAAPQRPTGATEPPAAAAPRRIPGRWLVSLRARSFDLAGYRAAVAGTAPAEALPVQVRALDAAVRADQRDFVAFVEALGGRVTDQWWITNGCAVELPDRLVDRLRAHPRVLTVHPDQWVAAATAAPLPIRTSTDANNHRAARLHELGITGRGVTLAVIDTGLDANMGGTGRPHRTFYEGGDPARKRPNGIAGSRILANVQVGKVPAEDTTGHGTAVAAVAAGAKWTTTGDSGPGHAPDADIVGYSVSDDAFGRSSLATLQNAWQQLARDRARYGILVANNSFTGSSDPTHPSQQALDALALNADVLCVVAAGNLGPHVVISQSAANGLAVGAVTQNAKTLASFSAVGPSYFDANRTYPDLVANGVQIVMPRMDLETSTVTQNGTSFAAPQVAGAAVLFRSVAPQRSALETKAALLATTEDVSAANPGLAERRNHLGMGYLRDDLLIELAQGRGLLQTATVGSGAPTRRFSMATVAGRSYGVVVAWHRTVLTSREWSDLDIEVVDRRGIRLGIASRVGNLYEKTVFRAGVTGPVDILVRGVRLLRPVVEFAVAGVETSPRPWSGGVATTGAGCRGTAVDPATRMVIPTAFAGQLGTTAGREFGEKRRRLQVVYHRDVIPAGGFRADGVTLRPDAVMLSSQRRWWTEIDMWLGHAASDPATMSNTFAQNVAGALTRVIARKRIDLQVYPGRNRDPRLFVTRLPFDTPFVYQAQPGRHLLYEHYIHDSASDAVTERYYHDAVFDRSATVPPVSMVTMVGNTVPFGNLYRGTGPVLGFSNSDPLGTVPVLAHRGRPDLGRTFHLDLSLARALAPGWLLLGVSGSHWAGGPLPFDLAAIGAPGCVLRSSAEHLLPLTTDATGRASFTVTLPSQPSLVQSEVFEQIWVVDPGANAAGISVTNGLVSVTGR